MQVKEGLLNNPITQAHLQTCHCDERSDVAIYIRLIR